MPGKMHSTLGEIAWNSLSEKDRMKWSLCGQWPSFAPDFIKKLPPPENAAGKMSVYCHFLDLMDNCDREYPEFLLPGNKPAPHGAADHNLNSCMTSSWNSDQQSSRIVLRTFIERASAEIKKQNMEKAALYAGLLAHVLQDAAALGHIFPNSMFYDFSPEERNVHINYHTMIDFCEPDLSEITPDILGAGQEELVFGLAMLVEKNIRYGKRIFFELLKACRENDLDSMNKLTAPMLQSSIYQTASLWRSLLYVNTASGLESKSYSLAEAVPYNCHPGGNYRHLTLNKNIDGNCRFIPLKLDFGNGPRNVDNSIGLSSFFSARYLLEPNAFRYFQGYVGLSCECLDDQYQEMDVEFFIGLDENYNRNISGNLDYGESMKKVYSIRLKPGRAAEKFTVELANAETLLFGAVCRPVAVNGKKKYCFPHIVLANPELVNQVDRDE